MRCGTSDRSHGLSIAEGAVDTEGQSDSERCDPQCSRCPPWWRAVVTGLWVAVLLLAALPVAAQHPAFRVKGRVVTERGEPIDKADVRLEAFYGYAAGTFAGPRKLSAQTNGKGEWSVGAMQPGSWLFEVSAPGYLPETVVLPNRILTTVSMGTSGMALTWDLVLKPVRAPDGVKGELLTQVAAAARDGKADEARAALQ